MKSLLLSHHHSTCALMSEILEEAQSDVILQPNLVQTQDLGKETAINYLFWLPRQIMHLLAFLFNLNIFVNVMLYNK